MFRVTLFLLLAISCVFAQDTTESDNKFAEWISSNGVAMDLKLSLQKGGFRDVIATCGKDQQANSVLVGVPNKLVITEEVVNTKVGSGSDDTAVQFALFLVSEKQNPSSFWKPFLDIMPDFTIHPLMWSAEDVEKITAADAKTALKQRREKLDFEFGRINTLLQDTKLFPNGVTKTEFMWGVSAASRYIRPCSGKSCIAPLLSNMQRVPSSNKLPDMLPNSDGTYVVDVAISDLKEGDVYYGSLGVSLNSVQLFLTYGEVFVDVPMDWREYSMARKVQDLSVAAAVLSDVIDSKCHRCNSFNITTPFPPENLYRWCRFGTLKFDDLDNFYPALNASVAISVDNELDAMRCALTSVDKLLKTIGSTQEEEESIIADKESSYVSRVSAYLGMRVRSLLEAQRKHIVGTWDNILVTATLTGHPAGFIR